MIPPNNFWWLSLSPTHVFIFQANLSGPPSEPFQSFQWSPLLGYQLRLILPLFSLNQVISPKILRLPSQVIRNDRSLRPDSRPSLGPPRTAANRAYISFPESFTGNASRFFTGAQLFRKWHMSTPRRSQYLLSTIVSFGSPRTVLRKWRL